jgi:DegV family protein with EDD domain
MEQYPDRKAYVVDTLCASLGEGLLLFYACQKRDEGMALENLRDWVEENKLHLCHWFTVDDLMFLKRGGRISGATAVLGTMLQIKPVLHVDDEGRLINMEKARGRKASMDALVRKVRQLGQGYDNRIVFVCHGDCPQEAAQLQKQLLEKSDSEKKVKIEPPTPTVSAADLEREKKIQAQKDALERARLKLKIEQDKPAEEKERLRQVEVERNRRRIYADY